ncbi:MAG: gamma-glutamylcyclotransferase family protein [Pseudomonadota bacterium]
MATRRIGYFGYGSLVNRQTLRTRYVDAVRAELTGFRREWRIRGDTPNGPACALTATPDNASGLQGLLVIDTEENLPEVDQREARYDRVAVPADALTLEQDHAVDALYVYVAKAVHTGAADPRFPIRQSYVDAVMQGYRTEFGDAGLERFVHETYGWDQVVLADRHQPLYPRAVRLSAAEQDLFDSLLSDVDGFRLVPLSEEGGSH